MSVVTQVLRFRVGRAIHTVWRALTAPVSAFRDIRIIVMRNEQAHHFYITASVQRAMQRIGLASVALAGCVVMYSGVTRWQDNRVRAANDALYTELLSAAKAEGSMSGDELQSLSSSDLAALLRERTGVLRGEVNAAADLLATSNGSWFDSLTDVGVPVSHDLRTSVGVSVDGTGGEDVVGAAGGKATTRINGELERSRKLMATVRRFPDRLPLAQYRTTSDFGLRRHPITFSRTLHEGLDLVSDIDQDVHAVRAGRVVFAARSGGYGNSVVIAHDGGIETRYAHLRNFTVARGDSVAEWQKIGTVGSTGFSTAPHLHYEIRLLGRALDPQRILGFRTNVK